MFHTLSGKARGSVVAFHFHSGLTARSQGSLPSTVEHLIDKHCKGERLSFFLFIFSFLAILDLHLPKTCYVHDSCQTTSLARALLEVTLCHSCCPFPSGGPSLEALQFKAFFSQATSQLFCVASLLRHNVELTCFFFSFWPLNVDLVHSITVNCWQSCKFTPTVAACDDAGVIVSIL